MMRVKCRQYNVTPKTQGRVLDPGLPADRLTSRLRAAASAFQSDHAPNASRPIDDYRLHKEQLPHHSTLQPGKRTFPEIPRKGELNSCPLFNNFFACYEIFLAFILSPNASIWNVDITIPFLSKISHSWRSHARKRDEQAKHPPGPSRPKILGTAFPQKNLISSASSFTTPLGSNYHRPRRPWWRLGCRNGCASSK